MSVHVEGTTAMSISIPLISRKYPGLFALVDEEDAELVSRHKWHPTRTNDQTTFYARTKLSSGRRVYLHRFIMDAQEGQLVDHADRDGLRNTRTNLRLCNRHQNGANAKRRTDARCEYRGVSWHKQNKKWRAYIAGDGGSRHLGMFTSAAEAARAYDIAASRKFGEFARLNFPEDKLHV